MPRVSAPSQQTYLRKHPSWESDDAAKAALGPVIAKWLASDVLEYVSWNDRMPILLQPCGAVPKGTAPFYRLITDARRRPRSTASAPASKGDAPSAKSTTAAHWQCNSSGLSRLGASTSPCRPKGTLRARSARSPAWASTRLGAASPCFRTSWRPADGQRRSRCSHVIHPATRRSSSGQATHYACAVQFLAVAAASLSQLMLVPDLAREERYGLRLGPTDHNLRSGTQRSRPHAGGHRTIRHQEPDAVAPRLQRVKAAFQVSRWRRRRHEPVDYHL